MQHNATAIARPLQPPPPPPSLLSSIQSARRHERHETSLSATTIFFSSVGKKRKPAGRVVVANLVGAWEKKHVGIAYTNGLHECARARQNIEYELLLLQRRPFPVFVMLEHVRSADGWGKQLSGENARMTLVYCVWTFLCCWGKRKSLCSTKLKTKPFININKLYQLVLISSTNYLKLKNPYFSFWIIVYFIFYFLFSRLLLFWHSMWLLLENHSN